MTTSRLVSIAYRLLRLVVGAVISAVAVIVFEVPAQIAPGGISGIAIILNHLVPALPIGLMILIGNIPIQLIAYRFLGGWKVVAATIFTVVLYSLLIDGLTPLFNGYMMSHDRLLNAIFGGIIGGIGGGIVLGAGGTLGGTSTLGRILQKRYGTPLSSSTLYTDGFVVLGAGLVFGLEGALYAMVTLYVAAATTDYVLEGPSVIRTSVIITDHPRELADAITSTHGARCHIVAGNGHVHQSAAHRALRDDGALPGQRTAAHRAHGRPGGVHGHRSGARRLRARLPRSAGQRNRRRGLTVSHPFGFHGQSRLTLPRSRGDCGLTCMTERLTADSFMLSQSYLL